MWIGVERSGWGRPPPARLHLKWTGVDASCDWCAGPEACMPFNRTGIGGWAADTRPKVDVIWGCICALGHRFCLFRPKRTRANQICPCVGVGLTTCMSGCHLSCFPTCACLVAITFACPYVCHMHVGLCIASRIFSPIPLVEGGEDHHIRGSLPLL